jgi:hypothetical protein
MRFLWLALLTAALAVSPPLAVDAQTCPYDPRCLSNPYGAGSPYKADGLMNPYSPYGSPYSPKSWTNPYATDAPRLYDGAGQWSCPGFVDGEGLSAEPWTGTG